MTLIKISGKSNNLNLKFEHPLMLKPDKQYKLGFVKMSLNDICLKKIVRFKYVYQFEVGNQKFSSAVFDINEYCSIETLKKHFVVRLKEVIDTIIVSLRNRNKVAPQWIDDFDYNLFKINVNYLNKHLYTVSLQTPVQIKIVDCGNFCDLLGLNLEHEIKPNQTYTSTYNPLILKPISLIEVHTNITEFSYSNNDSNLHVHNTHELLYPCFIDKVMLPKRNYIEVPSNVLYIPLRDGLRSISNIKVTLSENERVITDIKEVILYLHLLEL